MFRVYSPEDLIQTVKEQCLTDITQGTVHVLHAMPQSGSTQFMRFLESEFDVHYVDLSDVDMGFNIDHIGREEYAQDEDRTKPRYAGKVVSGKKLLVLDHYSKVTDWSKQYFAKGIENAACNVLVACHHIDHKQYFETSDSIWHRNDYYESFDFEAQLEGETFESFEVSTARVAERIEQEVGYNRFLIDKVISMLNDLRRDDDLPYELDNIFTSELWSNQQVYTFMQETMEILKMPLPSSSDFRALVEQDPRLLDWNIKEHFELSGILDSEFQPFFVTAMKQKGIKVFQEHVDERIQI